MSKTSHINTINAINNPKEYVENIIRRAVLYKDYVTEYDNALQKIDKDKDYQDKYRSLAVKLANDKVNEVVEYKKGLNEELLNKKRMVKLQTYETKRYKAINNVLIMLTLTFIALIINNFLKVIVPGFISLGLFILIVAIGGYLVFTSILDIYNRDAHDFDKYNFGQFNPVNHKQEKQPTTLTKEDILAAQSTCVKK